MGLSSTSSMESRFWLEGRSGSGAGGGTVSGLGTTGRGISLGVSIVREASGFGRIAKGLLVLLGVLGVDMQDSIACRNLLGPNLFDKGKQLYA